MKRAIREHSRDFVAIIALVVFALATVGVILVEQRFTLPSWFPAIGSDRFELQAELSSAQAITPGQGQTVNIAGIKVGDLSNVDLQNGAAVITMEIETRYAPLIHRDASILVRPRTGLADQTIELDPGSPGKPKMKEGTTLPLASTLPNVEPDEFLASLDGDTQGYLKLLLVAGGEGLGKNGRELSATLRRLDPTARDLALINGALAKRRQNIAQVIHDFGSLSKELAAHDRELADFVSSSASALGDFADQDAAIRASLQELPPTLRETRSALRSSDQLALTARPALTALLPQARALGPALKATQPFFRNTTGPIRDQIRPFARRVQPTVHHLTQGAGPLERSARGLAGGFLHLNRLLNALAYQPPGAQESFLFWLSWLNHDQNLTFAQDTGGPVQRGIVLLSCRTATVLNGLFAIRPQLKTIRDITNPPRTEEITAAGGCAP
jgi:phospholipid/cholesterol/gamma-HCH transport system substrate-binding protein